MNIAVLLTCHNRKEKTISCINGLSFSDANIHFYVVDDGSGDGTVEALENMRNSLGHGKELTVIKGDGNLFYSGGMRKAMEYARQQDRYDLYVLVNDDVSFDKGILDKVGESLAGNDTVLVGAMRGADGHCTYGGVKYTSGIHYKKVTPEDDDRQCDTFNANFVAIPAGIFGSVPIMDSHYKHSLGDFDYGLAIKRAGYRIEVMQAYAGICENNPSSGTWRDAKLSRIERLKKKESVKGAPFKQWFYFLNKNFGLFYALIYSLTPYIRILIGK
ncbi:glycosyltransferase family 2 protein [Butyrivibrio sp. NC2007]|uniref:glycosyltransferase family 2 protein n=1 Tax=Butyrivibrio sp. NC2007 TaxID=1280683 RepID=UPI0003F9D4D0|nr:glycosyltransferase family 2 protein [Butyrivibrio sp. NC2007]